MSLTDSMEKPLAAELMAGPIAVFSNSYARLPEHFFARLAPTPVPKPPTDSFSDMELVKEEPAPSPGPAPELTSRTQKPRPPSYLDAELIEEEPSAPSRPRPRPVRPAPPRARPRCRPCSSVITLATASPSLYGRASSTIAGASQSI